jgi:hypothetical protein
MNAATTFLSRLPNETAKSVADLVGARPEQPDPVALSQTYALLNDTVRVFVPLALQDLGYTTQADRLAVMPTIRNYTTADDALEEVGEVRKTLYVGYRKGKTDVSEEAQEKFYLAQVALNLAENACESVLTHGEQNITQTHPPLDEDYYAPAVISGEAEIWTMLNPLTIADSILHATK